MREGGQVLSKKYIVGGGKGQVCSKKRGEKRVGEVGDGTGLEQNTYREG